MSYIMCFVHTRSVELLHAVQSRKNQSIAMHVCVAAMNPNILVAIITQEESSIQVLEKERTILTEHRPWNPANQPRDFVWTRWSMVSYIRKKSTWKKFPFGQSLLPQCP